MSTVGTFIAVVLAALLVLGFGFAVSSYYSQHTQTITVQRHYIDNSGSESHYVVVGKDGSLWEVSNVLFASGQQNADYLWAQIDDGHTYCITYMGWSVPSFPLYWYPIILNLTNGTCVR